MAHTSFRNFGAARDMDGGVPPLENGDRLHSKEFLRRFEALPELKKAELIRGVVYMGSPVTILHSRPDSRVQTWIGAYAMLTPGTESQTNGTVILDPDNTVQPDASLLLSSGATRLSDDGRYVGGPPELVVEIAASSASIDLRDKREEYCRVGVCEYIVWNVYDAKVHWFVLEEEDYVEMSSDDKDVIRSRVFPGLWLDVPALLNGEGDRLLAVLNQGLTSPEHDEFVKKLAAK